MKYVFIGNCQIKVMHSIFGILCPTENSCFIAGKDFLKPGSRLSSDFENGFSNNEIKIVYSKNDDIKSLLPKVGESNLFEIPTVTYLSEMQDCVYVGKSSVINSGVGSYHSFIILHVIIGHALYD